MHSQTSKWLDDSSLQALDAKQELYGNEDRRAKTYRRIGPEPACVAALARFGEQL